MSIRVTQSMLNTNMMRNLYKSNNTLDKLQDQLSSGKRINRPSDDPVLVVRSMFYRSSVMEIEQFKRNAEDGLSWIDETDEALNQVTQVLHRVRELTVQGSNGTLEQTSLNAIADEIEQLKAHIGEIANTTIGDRFIFGGTDTKTKPFENGLFVGTNQEDIKWEVGHGNFLKVNVSGATIFPDILQALTNVVQDLRTGQSPSNRLTELDGQTENLLKERAVVGANMNRMEMILSRLDKSDITARQMLSQSEDADIAKVITDLKTQENVHRAALSAGARIIQPTLVDFLR